MAGGVPGEGEEHFVERRSTERKVIDGERRAIEYPNNGGEHRRVVSESAFNDSEEQSPRSAALLHDDIPPRRGQQSARVAMCEASRRH